MPYLIPSRDEALSAWAAQVRANREQAGRLREAPEGPDFYAPVAPAFRADPLRRDEAALDVLRVLARPGETWLDIGAGGGRYALPLAREVGKVIAIDPSPGMLDVLRQGMEEHDIRNIQVQEARWPVPDPPEADVALIAHVGYDVEDIGPFLDAMERSARRLCVCVMLASAPASAAAPLWPLVHGEERALLPALAEFLVVLLARGRLFNVTLAGGRDPLTYPDAETALRFARQQLFVQQGSDKDRRLQSVLAAWATPGGIRFPGTAQPIAVVSWAPRP